VTGRLPGEEGEAIPTVHEIIDANRSEILRLWVQGIRESAFAEDLSPSEVAGVMPDYLGSLGQIAIDGAVELGEQQRDVIEKHLSNRLRQGSTLNEILTEFAVLGRVIAWFLDRNADDSRPSARDAANLFGELHLACIAAMKTFNEQLLEDEQPVKRYLRLLQNLASASEVLPESRQPLRILMKDALSLIAKACPCRSVSLRLHDARSDELIMGASAGDAEDLIEDYIASVAITPPTAEVKRHASSGASVGDFVALETNAALRARGIHSLLALHLTARQTLRAVMYVGLGKRETLSASELRQVATLGEALAIHIDHAQLCAELRLKAAEAVAECQLRERFVSMLMHDLAGPLAAARASAVALLAPGGAGGGEALAARVIHEVARAEGMVSLLVDAHHIRAGHRLPMHITRCSLATLTRDTVAELRVSYGDRFIFEADADVWGMWSADQLRRAAWNLASNAVKFGAQDSPVLISVRRSADGAELVVHNEGAAIPADEQAALFRPFASPDSGRGHPHGWGLGLTLVWGCAEAHGGRVQVASLPGQGTTFKLVIPFDARPYSE
jgi:signal transduction histidine kinase